MNHQPSSASRRKPVIILLEDERLLRHFFEDTIRAWSTEVDLRAFENGDDVWRELSHARPDLLITDALHPGMDGGGIVCKLAEIPTRCAVLWTSGGSDYTLASFFPRLKIEVLPKPFGPEQLREKLELLLGARTIAAGDVAPRWQELPTAGAAQPAAPRW
jgi:DNA-binding NtrC family response regulator